MILVFDNGKSHFMRELSQELLLFFQKSEVSVIKSKGFFETIRLLIFFRPLVIFPAPHSSNLFWVLFARVFFLKTIVGIHDVDAHDSQDVFKVKCYNQFVCSISSEILVFSNFSKVELEKKFGVVPLLYYFKSEMDFSPAEKNNDVLVFGRFREYQGRALLSKIVGMCPDLSFAVWGVDAPRELENFKNVNLKTTFIQQEDLLEIVSSSRAVLMPYLSATQSGHIPLVLSRGASIVGFDVGALKEQCGSLDRFIVESGNLADLVSALNLAVSSGRVSAEDYREWQSRLHLENESFASYVNELVHIKANRCGSYE